MGAAMRISGASNGLIARQGLNQATRGLRATFETLASGSRLSRAANDPSATAISSRLTAEIRSLNSTTRGLSDGIGLTRSAGGQLEEVSSLLTRMRELSVQSSNGTLSVDDRELIQNEFDGLREEVDRLSESADFNGQSLFDGSNSTISIPVGTNAAEQLEIDLQGVSASDLGIESSDVTSADSAAASLEELDAALGSVNEFRGELGATENRLSSSLRSVGAKQISLAQSNSVISDADLALETAVLAQQQLLQKGAASVLLQSNVAVSRAQSLLGGFV